MFKHYTGAVKVFLWLLICCLAIGQAQTTIVILPFSGEGEIEPYHTAIPTALQRSLNVIDGVFVPPIGDALLVSQQLQRDARLSPQTVAALFDADYVLSGRLSRSDETLSVLLGITEISSAQVQSVSLSAAMNDPRAVMQNTINSLIATMQLNRTASDAQELEQVSAQIPALTVLPAVAQASLRLTAPDSQALEAASSSWGLAERARLVALAGNLTEAEALSLLAFRSSQQDIEALIIRGDILRLRADDVNAKQAYSNALAINPGHPLALEGLARLSEPREAKELLDQALGIYPRLVTAYLTLAELEAASNPARALQILRRGAGRVPESLTLHRAIMDQARNLESPRAALTYLQQAVADERLVSEGLYSLVSIVDKDLVSESIELIRQGRQRYPRSSRLALVEAQLWLDSGNLAQAEVTLQEARVVHPDDLTLLNELARVQVVQGNLAAAAATLEAGPANDTLAINLAQIYLEAGEAQAAVDTLAPLLSIRPDDAQLFSLYGVALGYTGNLSQALNVLDQALALDSQLKQALVAKAVFEQQLALTQGQSFSFVAEAERAFQLGLEALSQQDYPNAALYFSSAFGQQDAGLIAFYEGYALLLGRQPRPAIAKFERALEDFPDSDIVYNNLGYAYLQVGRYDRAMQFVGQALALNPDNAEANLNQGLTLLGLRRYGEAVPFLQRATVLKPALSEQVTPLVEEAVRLSSP